MPDAVPIVGAAKIAVLDTGVAYRNWGQFARSPDFGGTRFIDPYDFVANNAFPLDREGHGTFVTGEIAETTNNNYGLTGLACVWYFRRQLTASAHNLWFQGILPGVGSLALIAAFVLSVALFFVWLVAVGVLYGVLDGMGVWDRVNGTYNEFAQNTSAGTSSSPLITASRVFGIAAPDIRLAKSQPLAGAPLGFA